jgi:hypothetical protein
MPVTPPGLTQGGRIAAANASQLALLTTLRRSATANTLLMTAVLAPEWRCGGDAATVQLAQLIVDIRNACPLAHQGPEIYRTDASDELNATDLSASCHHGYRCTAPPF